MWVVMSQWSIFSKPCVCEGFDIKNDKAYVRNSLSLYIFFDKQDASVDAIPYR